MNIWVPRTKILEPKHELVLPGNRVSGHFKIEGRLDDGRRRLIAGWQPNLITDGGLERWGTGAVVTHGCVGSGSTVPAVGDTALVSHVASATAVRTSYGARSTPPYYGWAVFTITFTPPGSNQNLSEVGLGWASGGGSLFSRALIKDGGGSPTTITWLAAETLIVTWECRSYPWTDDVLAETTISSTTHDVTIRASSVTSSTYWRFYHNPIVMGADAAGFADYFYVYNGAIGAITATPGGASAVASSTSFASYSAASLKRTGTLTWLPAVGNWVGGILAVRADGCTNGSYQMGWDPAIMKEDTDTLTLHLSSPVWGRYA